MAPDQPPKRIGYLGPRGTYTEYALGSRPELAAADARGYPSIPDVLAALADGEVDAGFVPIENSIEGAVNVTQDALAFDLDLLVQREVVVDVRLDLLAPPGTALDDVHTVVSFPVALAQCRNFLRTRLADVRTEAAKSTAEAARRLGEDLPAGVATVASPLAGEVYGLETLATAVEDHPGNQTRFLLLAPTGIPAPTGHDKTSVVVFQRRNAPGSLLAILQEFAARGIDLTRLESRPTRRSLGDYCFLLDFVGHVADEVVSDCLRNLKMKQHDVKFLGSYPAAAQGPEPAAAQSEAAAARRDADAWVDELRRGIAS